MTKPRPLPGTLPAALSRTGKDVPPSPEVAAAAMADAIGMAAAMHLAELLEPVFRGLADQQGKLAQSWCIVCSAKVKRLERAHEVAVANARAAAEPEPEAPGDQITQAVTEGGRGPVCWGCYDPDIDGPYDGNGTGPFDTYLPPAVD